MRIKVEKLSDKHTPYTDRPENEVNFLRCLGWPHISNGEIHEFWISPYKNRSVHNFVRIGFKNNGEIYINPLIRTKSGRMSMDAGAVSKVFGEIMTFVESAAKYGFLDWEEETE